MKHAKAVRRIIFTVLIVAAVIVGFNTYTADYYHAKDYELQTTEVSETDAYIAYGDPQSETGTDLLSGSQGGRDGVRTGYGWACAAGNLLRDGKDAGAPCHFKAECGG